MPLLTGNSLPDDWVDPDLVPRAVVTFGRADVVVADLDEQETDLHKHEKGELLLSLRGLITCEANGSLWILPPQSALWIPGGTLHKVKGSGVAEGYVTLIDSPQAGRLPAHCCAITPTALLRELVVRSATLPMLYPEGGMESRLVSLLVDELALAPTGRLHLPMPADSRLRKIFDLLLAEPADRGTIGSWARRVALSERTLARLIVEQTGMSFGRWRQQFHVILSLQWLASGRSIQHVADGLGYESVSSFASMFRKAMGLPPAAYMTQWRAQRG